MVIEKLIEKRSTEGVVLGFSGEAESIEYIIIYNIIYIYSITKYRVEYITYNRIYNYILLYII